MAEPPRVPAEFHRIVASPRTPGRSAIALDAIATDRALASVGLALHEGLALVIWEASDETEDLEARGAAHFDARQNRWVIELDDDGVSTVPRARPA
jgi:hypothetical protein